MSGTAGVRYYTPSPFEIDANGVPLAGAQLFTYATGTTTPQFTYSDVNLTTPNTNPIIADANGRFGSVFLIPTNAYRVQLWTAPTDSNPTGSQIWSEDPVGPASGGVPSNVAGIIGEVRAFAGPSASVPSGWYLCYGQAVSRTTYSAAFAVLGTTWGSGDGSTTFNLPDLRGRGLFGIDNMGGTAASRITSAVSGIPGTSLGGTGGSQLAQQPVLTATTTATSVDAGHNHPFTPGTVEGSGATNRNTSFAGGFGDSTPTIGTGYASITTTCTTTVTSNLTGSSQNMPPAAMVNMMIYLGA